MTREMGGIRTLPMRQKTSEFPQSRTADRLEDILGVGTTTATCPIQVGIKAKEAEREIICGAKYLVDTLGVASCYAEQVDSYVVALFNSC